MRPSDKDAGLLGDILKACNQAREFSRGLDLDHFVGNSLVCHAIERCLEIVGEAASRISPAFRHEHPEIPWRDIKGLRNILAHEYGHIDHELIYKTVTQDVLLLVSLLEKVLRTESGGPQGVRERHVPYDHASRQAAKIARRPFSPSVSSALPTPADNPPACGSSHPTAAGAVT